MTHEEQLRAMGKRGQAVLDGYEQGDDPLIDVGGLIVAAVTLFRAASADGAGFADFAMLAGALWRVVTVKVVDPDEEG